MNAIERRRRERGLTQSRLANLLNVDQTAVSKWETGETLPRADKLPELARILKCSIDELLSKDKDKETA